MDLATKTWNDNYKCDGEKSIDDSRDRWAIACASVEKVEIRKQVEDDFKFLFHGNHAYPGGRIMANLGVSDRASTTLYNCFVLDSFDAKKTENGVDSLEGIYEQLGFQSQTLKSEGGYGHNFSYIRPEGTYVDGIGSRTPGVLHFMRLWNESSDIITLGSQKTIGGRQKNEKNKIRKGAMMGVLNIWHPQIVDFIKAKQVSGAFSKFNLSVGITEGFHFAKDNDLDWELVFPDTKHPKYNSEWDGHLENWKRKGYPIIVYEVVKARELWEVITQSTYNRNEPGVLDLELANRINPLSYAEIVSASNPCQPAWASVLTRTGLSTIGEVKIGDEIWTRDGWSRIADKWSTGVKKVNKYKTSSGIFYGTENHRILQNGVKVEVKDAKSIDYLVGDLTTSMSRLTLDPQDIMDGLVIGDGFVHKASNNLVALCIGKNDSDYFTSEVSQLITKHRPALNGSKTSYEIETTIESTELPLTFNRVVPKRFKTDFTKMCGFLRGLYSANGSFVGNRVTLKQSSLKLIEDVQEMLSALGIRSYITTNASYVNTFANGDYTCKESYDLNITSDRMIFKTLIGFLQNYKMDKIIELEKPTRSKTTFPIQLVSEVSEEEVFDLTIDNESHTYWSGGCDVSNCGEIIMSTGVCNLLSLNLTSFLVNGKFDFELFAKCVQIGVRFSDNINDISVLPLPEYEKSVKEKRRIGVGVLGLGSLHLMLGIRYGSEESLALCTEIFKTKCENELIASSNLGLEKGNFSLFDKDKFFSTEYWKTLDIDVDLKKSIEVQGTMRNSHRSANAPTGNMGIVANIVSGGIEPTFDVGYSRWVSVTEGAKTILESEGLVIPTKSNMVETDVFKFELIGDEKILMGKFNGREYQIDTSRGLTIRDDVFDYGWKYVLENFTTEQIEQMKKEGKFDTALNGLGVMDHLNVLKIVAKYTDMNSSKTINLPNDYPYEDFLEVYSFCAKNGIKGATTYRSGTMTEVMFVAPKETSKEQEKVEESFIDAGENIIQDDVKLPSESFSKCYTIKDNNKKKWYVHLNFVDSKLTKPFAIFVNTNSTEDSEVTENTIHDLLNLAKEVGIRDELIDDQLKKIKSQSNIKKIARSIGFLLRHNVPIIKIVYVIDQGNYPLSSFTFHIKRLLKQFIVDGVKVEGKKCDQCDSHNIVMQEGCYVCMDCGGSKCG